MTRSALVLAAACAAALAICAPSGAAPDPAALPGGAWASVARLPDFTGVWNVKDQFKSMGKPRPRPKLTPAYAAPATPMSRPRPGARTCSRRRPTACPSACRW